MKILSPINNKGTCMNVVKVEEIKKKMFQEVIFELKITVIEIKTLFKNKEWLLLFYFFFFFVLFCFFGTIWIIK